MASIKADTIPIAVSLEKNPRLNYPKWRTAVLQWAVTQSINGFSLSNQLLTNEEWENEFPPINEVPQARLPAFPARLIGNATASAVLNWKYDTDVATSALALAMAFKTAILNSIGAAINNEFADPLRGHIDHEIHQIMNFIKIGYGTVTEADIELIKEDMIINETKSWRENVGTFNSIFTLLAPIGHYTTDLDKRSAMDKAISKTRYAPILKAYKDHTPLLAERTFDAQCSYIELRESNLSASEAGYAGKAEANYTALNAEIAALTATVAALSATPAAAPTNPPSQGRGGGRGGGRTQGRGRGRGRGQQETYCFAHGHNKTHKGTECKTMENDTSYTQAMKTASAPCLIDGYYGKN